MLENGTYPVPAGKMAVVVTYLEMHAPAATREVTLPEGITFRQVHPTREWYRDTFGRVGSHDYMWYGRLKLDDDALDAILQNPDVAFYTLSKDGTDEALLELDFRISGECELVYFGLTAPLIGSGAGRYLMNEAIRRAWAAPITRFHVHTCTTDSPQALDFYIRSGFTAFKREIDIDDDPRIHGTLPKDAAAKIPVI
jgi:GNAT superfamily N-acetyltransferase